MSFAPGSLVKIRNREWVVLPESIPELLMVRPLGGTDEEITGILTDLETVESATFDMPTVDDLGDYRSAKLLRDALRLGFRSSGGPFRSLAKIAVEPRPYQLVPLLMALKLDPVRLLIADDVGIGKTIEAGLVARELIEEGRASRLCVLCPPHLAEQWQAELRDKFHIDAQLVLASTAARLERSLPVGKSIFDVYDYTIVSIDFIKGDRRRDDFIRACPELVIVDEAHSVADAGEGRGSRHQRHRLVADLSANVDRHLILVTATPHSGKAGSFRSLLALLDDEFQGLPDSLAGEANRGYRDRLAEHVVQRRRDDIRNYLDTASQFPDRTEGEAKYTLTAEYRDLFDEVLSFARETVRTADGPRQRVRWWSALGLLRALASSPAAAAATMRTRAATADAATEEEADEIGRQVILDLDDPEEGMDVVPGGNNEGDDSAVGRRLRQIAEHADELRGAEKDAKLAGLIRIVKSLIKEGHQPIIFCRFIETAEYVASELRSELPNKVHVEAVTGRIPPAERENRIEHAAEQDKRVLVATDCLSEGINLQDSFSAVVHYDLPWNPTRLEQREGRVDRYGQPADQVKVLTYYGADNQIDEIVLDVLLRKHVEIRKSLGISIPVPGTTNDVIEALAQRLLDSDTSIDQRLPGFDDYLRPTTEQLHFEWDEARDKEQRSRSIFAQNTIDPAEVSKELEELRDAIGSAKDVEEFVRTAIELHNGVAAGTDLVKLDLSETGQAFKDALGVRQDEFSMDVKFELPVAHDQIYLARTHPFVTGLAGHLLDQALDPIEAGSASRGGVIRTADVATRTTLVLNRLRMNLVADRSDAKAMIAEEAALIAWTGSAADPHWLNDDEIAELLSARPTANVSGDASFAAEVLAEALESVGIMTERLEATAHQRAESLAQSHMRVRESAGRRGGLLARYRAEPQLPVDVLGVYVYLPEVTL